MAYYMHAGHWRPAGLFKAIKYSPYNVNAQCEKCNIELESNLRAYALALEKRCGFGILRTLEPIQALLRLHRPAPRKDDGDGKTRPKEYLVFYEGIRPKEERELEPKAA